SFRKAGFIRCQVPGDDVRAAWNERTEISASTQVGCRVDDLLASERSARWHEKVGVSVRQVLGSPRPGVVAAVAVALSVHDVTPQAHQRPILSCQIQGNGRYGKALLNLRFLIIRVIGPQPERTQSASNQDQRGQCRGCSEYVCASV